MRKPDVLKKGLASCSSDECHGDHADCPYIDSLMCIREICGDALVYIKQLEQALRTPLLKPLTLAEIRSVAPDRPLYLETKCVDGLGHLWGADAADMIQGYYGKNEYGHIFRYWPDRKPTEEERKAAEWMD